MRRTLAAGLLALATATATLTTVLSADATSAPHADRAAGRAAVRADAALQRAKDVLAGEAGRHADATMALTSLRASYRFLSAAEQRQADVLLARPTDGAADPYGDGYRVKEATPLCKTHICVHYVRKTSDKPVLTDANGNGRPDWVEKTAQVMESVWAYEVGSKGYRAPAPDGKHGGNSKLDIYLADVGADFLYGYCAPEYYVPHQNRRASGFCVLDNDFAFSQFGAPPLNSLKVTAAHEFFHAIQFNYDFKEDRWIMEATATWMEERYADNINDNRQYLDAGQLGVPGTPLDIFQNSGAAQYGNWIFFERLSKKYGAGAIKTIWKSLDGTKGATNDYSIKAVRKYTVSKGVPFPRFYADFAAGNLSPVDVYDEGEFYNATPLAHAPWPLTTPGQKANPPTKTLNHLTSAGYRFETDPGGTTTTINLEVNAPNTTSGPAAYVQVFRTDGTVSRAAITLDSTGDGIKTVGFDPATVDSVTLTLANGSTRYDCFKGTGWSCHGTPLDDGKPFSFVATAG